MKKIAIIRFWFEGNSFSPALARRADFESREWVSGDAAVELYTGMGVETGAAVDFLRDHEDIEGHFIFCAAAYPAGPMEAGLFADILARVRDGLAAQAWDGVYVSLHGSSVCQDEPEPEVTLLKAVREITGDIPLAATFDLHANLSPEIAGLADIVAGYKTHPHVDMVETGTKALGLLRRAMLGEIRPSVTIVPAEFAPTSFNMRTEAGPMADMAALAREAEAVNDFHDVTAFGGFVLTDSPHTGAAVSVCAEAGSTRARPVAEHLAAAFRGLAPRFHVHLPPPQTLLREIRDQESKGPVAVLEPSDNVFSGGVGDTPGLLRAVLEVMSDIPSVFAFFCDPGVAAAAHANGLGATMECALGGRLSRDYGDPVQITARVETLTDGRFQNIGPMEKGLPVDLGKTAVLSVAEVRIIVTSRNGPVNDMAYFHLHGIELAATRFVFVKAKNHFRAAFTEHFERIVETETKGPAPSDVLSLPYRYAPRERLAAGKQAE